MKKNTGLYTIIILAITACQPSLKVPVNSDNNFYLNSLITLESGENILYLQDFIQNTELIDSLTSTSEKLSCELSDDKQSGILTAERDMEHFVDVKVWIKGTAYSIPCRKTDKISYTFKFNPRANAYKRVQIVGQMNEWTATLTPDLQLKENRMYEVELMLRPGVYMYQLVLDGEQTHDANNPKKVDNGFGQFNSKLEIKSNDDSLPRITTESYSARQISLSYTNQVSEVFVYWQNYRLPVNFTRTANGKIAFDIPMNARHTKRSHIRVWASNQFGVSNDILIPLHKGEVLMDAKHIDRTDKHAQMMYFMLVDRFKNGNTNNDVPMNRADVHPKVDYWGGDLAGLQKKIEDGYFEKLGFNTLWISPLNENPAEPYGYYEAVNTKFSGYHGYWPVSSSRVDYRFGTNDELKNLVAKAHTKKMNVLLDYVANHVHEDHPLYQQFPEFATPLYLADGTKNVEKWDEHRLTTWFDDFMPTLDFSKPEVVEMMTDSALFWIKEFNLDGFRHDACKHIQNEFWRTLTAKLKKEFPGKNIYQIGETYGSPELIGSFMTTGMLDGQFDFNVYDAANKTFAGINPGNMVNLAKELHTSFGAYGHHNLMGYISGNHDKPRFMAYASGDILYGEDTKAAGWLRDIGITDSTAYDKFLLFHAFNLTIPGIPVVYYGDEIGMTGGNDPDCRRMMRFEGWNNRENNLWNSIAALAQVRRKNPVFIYGSFINIETTDDTWIYARKYFDKKAFVIINNSPESKSFKVSLPENMTSEKLKAVYGNGFTLNANKLSIDLSAYSVEVLY